MKVIFLDVDGVLNCRERWADCEQAELGNSLTRIDPRAVERLKRIVDATDAKIVVSSTWRLYHYDDLKNYLGHFGMRRTVISSTPRLPGELRGEEIKEWLKDNESDVTSFVILDDDSDMGDLVTYLVKTSFQTGLQDEHVEQAIRMLNGKKEA